MFNRYSQGPLYAADAGAGGDAGVSSEMVGLINQEINKAFAAFMKKELPKLFKTEMQNSFQEMIPQIGEAVIGQIQEALPSDEELAQLEAEEGGARGGNQGGNQNGENNGFEGEYRIPPELNAELLDLRKYRQTSDERLAQLEQEREEASIQAEALDRTNTIQSFLNKYQFANDASREVAFNFFDRNAERDNDGNLIANGLPISNYIDDNMGHLAGLLATRPVGGVGATAGGRTPAGPQIEEIKPGMSKDSWTETMAAAVAQLPTSVRGGTA